MIICIFDLLLLKKLLYTKQKFIFCVKGKFAKEVKMTDVLKTITE